MPSFDEIKQWLPLYHQLEPAKEINKFYADTLRDSDEIYLNGSSVTSLLNQKGCDEAAIGQSLLGHDEEGKVRHALDEVLKEALLSNLPEEERDEAFKALQPYFYQRGPGCFAANSLKNTLQMKGFFIRKDEKHEEHWEQWRMNDQGELEVMSICQVDSLIKFDENGQEQRVKLPNHVPLVTGVVKTVLKFAEGRWVQTSQDAVVYCRHPEIKIALESYSKDGETIIQSLSPIKTEGARALAQKLIDDDETQNLYQELLIDLKKYKHYLEGRYKPQREIQGLLMLGSTAEKSLAQQKYDCICDIEDAAERQETIHEKLTTLADALYRNRELLSKHHGPNEKTLWGKIKQFLISHGLWQSKGQQAVARLDKKIAHPSHHGKHGLFKREEELQVEKSKTPRKHPR